MPIAEGNFSNSYVNEWISTVHPIFNILPGKQIMGRVVYMKQLKHNNNN